MSKLIFTLITCITLFYSCIKSINRPITDYEISAIGTGFQVLYNLSAKEKFAIMESPLPGIILYSLLSGLYKFEVVYPIPSGDYFDMVSFIFAMESPKMIGSEILSVIGAEKFTIVRYLNIVWVALILYIISRRNILLGGVLALILCPITDVVMTSTIQILSALLIILALELLISIINCTSYLKFILLGIVIGLLIAASGSDGLLLFGMVVVSQVVWRDINEKKLSKGFKKDWIIGSFITFLIAFFISWIAYGMDLACFCQLQSLLGFEPTNRIRVVPFFDAMKRMIFDVIFKINDHKYSFYENISTFFNIYNGIITTISLLYAVIKRNQYGIFSIVLLISVFIYNDIYEERVHRFLEIVSILMSVMIPAQIVNCNSKGNKRFFRQ